MQRRIENFSKADGRFQGKSAKLDTLQKGLETCEEVIVSITDPADEPGFAARRCPAHDRDQGHRERGLDGGCRRGRRSR